MDDRTVVAFDQHSPEYKASFPQISHDLRSQCPAAWTEEYGGYWVISGRELIGEMAKHPDLLSNDHDPLGARHGYEGIAIPSPEGATTRGGFIEMDPPEQLEYRRVLNPYLSPAAIERWRPMVGELSQACIDEVIESGELDFVDDLANVVPAVLTMGLLGFPLVDWVIYCEPAHALVYTPPHSPEFPRVLDQTLVMAGHLAEELEKARTNPRPGMLKALTDAQAAGAPFVGRRHPRLPHPADRRRVRYHDVADLPRPHLARPTFRPTPAAAGRLGPARHGHRGIRPLRHPGPGRRSHDHPGLRDRRSSLPRR